MTRQVIRSDNEMVVGDSLEETIANKIGRLNKQRKFAKAIADGAAALLSLPESFLIHFNTANAARKNGELDLARRLYKRAIHLNPSDHMAWNNLGLTLLAEGNQDGAKAAFRKSVALSAEKNISALVNYSLVCRQTGDAQEAIKAANIALTINPTSMEAYANRAAIYHELNMLEPALYDIGKAAEIAPGHPSIFYNKGNIYVSLCRWEKAIECFNQALSLEPDLKDAAINKSICLLMQNKWEQGFLAYESRWSLLGKIACFQSLEQVSQFREKLYVTRSVEIYAEQGLGDAIQFLRYLLLMPKEVTATKLYVHPPLVNLVKESNFSAEVLPLEKGSAFSGTTSSDGCLKLPLLSLPLMLGIFPGQDRFPCSPYLRVDKGHSNHWWEKISAYPNIRTHLDPSVLRVGICWAGNPQQGTDKKRSIPFSTVSRLFSIPCRWINLKVELTEEVRIRLSNHRVEDYSTDVSDLRDTAALLSTLDLVISTCTSVAHLAGSLGLSTWVLLAFSPDWRWSDEGETSLWYPTSRLFRQRTPGDWEGVLDDVEAALLKKIDEPQSRYE